MPYDLTEPLVIGIGSRALFNLEEENKIYEECGVDEYEEYQIEHENAIELPYRECYVRWRERLVLLD